MKRFNPIFEIYNNALFFNYWQVYTEYDNKHFNKRYHSLEYWFIRISFEKKLFDFNVYRYDAFTLNEIVLLGITLGYGYNCISKPVTEELFD